jgi:hypothetical protein
MICSIIMMGCVVAMIGVLAWVAFKKDDPQDNTTRWEENLK